MTDHTHPGTGLLIALEGIDGAGKTTQATQLAAWLRQLGHEVVQLKEPTSGPHGMELRRLARDGRDDLTPQREFELFRDDRSWNAEENILPALRRGAVVLLDRYYISSMAYQGARGLEPKMIRVANEAIAPIPDLVVLFDLPVEEALRRIRARDEHGPDLFEREGYLARVREIFLTLNGFPAIVRLDATEDPIRVQGALRAAVESLL